MRKFFVFFLTLGLLISQASAQEATTTPVSAPTKFTLPLDCTFGEQCWVLAYIDMATQQGSATDYKCAPRSTDDNKGTDFAIRDRRAMEDGVDVLAAANGTIMRMRDGADDDAKTDEELADVKARNRDCGNGVVIDHGNNLQTVYCHLKKDSIEVDQDQRVTKGQKIAEVGGSGYSKIPHLHFGIIKGGAIIDPFSGLNNQDTCGTAPKGSLWEDENISYQDFGIFDAGFRTNVPDFEVIKTGEINPETLPRGAQALTFWAGYYGALTGDEVRFEITAPNGTIFVERSYKQTENSARQYYYTGRKIKGGLLQTGNYVGTVTVKRGNNTQSMTRILKIIE